MTSPSAIGPHEAIFPGCKSDYERKAFTYVFKRLKTVASVKFETYISPTVVRMNALITENIAAQYELD